MKRIRVILGWLLAGAVVNIAVAWGLASWPQTNVHQWFDMTDSHETLGVDHWGDDPRPIPLIVYSTNERLASPRLGVGDLQLYGGTHRFGIDIYSLDTRVSRNHACKTQAVFSGGPKRSLWAHYTFYLREAVGQADRDFMEWESGILYVTQDNQWIPWRPSWPGFTINTIIYGGFLWIIFVGRSSMIRRIRLLRGRCPHCAYDLRHAVHVACPECGEAIRAARAAS